MEKEKRILVELHMLCETCKSYSMKLYLDRINENRILRSSPCNCEEGGTGFYVLDFPKLILK
jgi:hypothetical protein